MLFDYSVRKNQDLGGLPPKPPIGGRLRPPNPLQKVLSTGAQAFEKNNFFSKHVVFFPPFSNIWLLEMCFNFFGVGLVGYTFIPSFVKIG